MLQTAVGRVQVLNVHLRPPLSNGGSVVSGYFSTPSLLCCVMEMGADRIMFSVDYPFVPNPPGVKWMADVPLSPTDRENILGGTAKKLLRL